MNANQMRLPMPVARDAGALRDLQRDAGRVATLLKAMSNPARLIILCQIAEGERSVGELERAVGLSQSAISQHLAMLRSESIVSSRRVRQTMLYSLASKEVVAIITTLHAVFCRDGRAPKALVTRARRT
jgi:DNA-binding transcriptional ArsR family regulator